MANQDLLGNELPTPLNFYSKEITIMQQSQSKLALDFLTSNGIVPTAQVLWRVTQIFIQCCLHEQTPELKKQLKDLDNWIAKNRK